MTNEGRLAKMFHQEHSKRGGLIERKRQCAALTKPSYLPPEGQDDDDKLPETYQSLGSRGITSLENKLLLATFSPGQPWFRLRMPPEIEHGGELDDDQIVAVYGRLAEREMIATAILASGMADRNAAIRRRNAFYSHKRSVLGQALVVGDALEHMGDDYRLRSFRFDHYVTRRDACGDVLLHVTHEKKDLRSFTEDELARIDPAADKLNDDDPSRRMVDLWTFVLWNPRSRVWTIEQEAGGVVFNESEETVSPYFSTAYDLTTPESYGRSFVEQNLGDIKALDRMGEYMLDFAALASFNFLAIDQSSELRGQDFEQTRGSVIENARVRDGRVVDAAFFKAEQIADFSVCAQNHDRLHAEMSRVFLLDADSIRDSERTTATEVQRTIQQIEGHLGGAYAAIAEQQQVPLLRRLFHQLERDMLIPKLPEGSVRYEIETGLPALQRERQVGKLDAMLQRIAQLGEPALEYIDIGELIYTYERYASLDAPGVIKSRETVEREREQAQAAALQQQAAQQAIESTGAIAEAQATQGGQ